MRRWLMLLLILLFPNASNGAASLVVTKSSAVVADGVSTLNPKALPGALVDYAVTASNPLLNPVFTGVRVTDIFIPDGETSPKVKLRVADYQTAGEGPVHFGNINLLGISLSGVSYTYGGLTSAGDGLEFYDGSSWAYQPVADADGYDPRVRGIRVTLSGSQVSGGAFRLNYRVQVR